MLEARLSAKPEASTRVLAAFDQQVAAWAAQSAAACVTASRRAAAPVDFQRVACLKRRGLALQIFVDAIGQAGPTVVARSDELVKTFLGDSTCEFASQLSRLTSDDVPDEQAEAGRTLRASLLRAHALNLTDRGTEALAQTRAAGAAARDAGLTGFESEARYLAGVIEYYQGDEAEAVHDFEQSLRLALAAGIDQRALYAGTRLVRRLAHKTGRLGEAQQVLGVVEALWARLGNDERLEAEVNWARRAVLNAQGKQEDSVILAQRDLEVATRIHGPRSYEAYQQMVSLSSSLWDLGKVEESNRLEVAALQLLKDLYGPDDSALTTRYLGLGQGLSHEGRQAEAQAMLETGLELARRKLEPADSTTADLMLELSWVLEGVDEGRALELAAAAVTFYEPSTDERSLGGALRARSRALVAARRPREALADCMRARAVAAHEADASWARSVLTCEGEALEASGDWAGAYLAWQKVREVKPPALLPATLGRAAFGLARALRATGKRARAEEVGREALRHYNTFPGFARERAEIEAWILVAR